MHKYVCPPWNQIKFDMSAKDKLPEIVDRFVTDAKLFAAVCVDTNADTMKQNTDVTHYATGKKFHVTLVIKEIKS